MKIVKVVLIVVLVLLAVGVFVTPVGPVPGFFIGGSKVASPATWPDTASVHEVRLGVHGTIPRVVIIWVVEHQGELHVVGSRESGWVKMLGEGGPVDLRIGDNTYAVNAVRVDAGSEDILAAYIGKYQADYPEIVAGFPALEEARGTVGVFRLERG